MRRLRLSGATLRWAGGALMGVGTALVLALILALGLDARRQVEVLAVANSDSAQWSVAQGDVELLALQVEVLAGMTPGADLAPLRRRFDVFYSRIGIMQRGPLYERYRDQPGLVEGLAQASAFVDRSVALIDSPDEVLRAGLPDMLAGLEEVRPVLRQVTLGAHRMMAAGSDQRREHARSILARTAGLTFALVAILVVMIAALGWLARQARRRAEEQARTRARLQAIIDTSFDAILVLDGTGHILDYNGAAEQLFGRSRAQVLGRDAGMLLDRPLDPETAPGRGPHRITGLHANGRRFPAECSVGAVASGEGPVRVLFLHDISDRLEAEAALVEARDRAVAGEQAKADMLAVMSHEMRTPLNGILGTLDLMADTRLTPRQREYLRIIRDSGGLLLDHVNDVLDISRLDAGKMPVASQPFDAGHLLRDLVESQRPAAAAQGNRLELRIAAPGISRVLGDAVKLRQALLNLLGNAIKFTRRGTITITACRLPGDRIEFGVRDTGIGIAASDLGRIFEDFVTLDSSYGRSAEGSGLGLPITQRLVRAMGGSTTVDSLEGMGSLFRITLPLPPAPAGAELPAAAPPPPAAPAGLQVLVVEDNGINRFVVISMLAGDGHRVDSAINGAEGLRMARLRHYDLILMDIAMPEMDGIAATQAIRRGPAASQHTAIVALTAHTLPADLERFTRAGISDTLLKPLAREDLRALTARIAAGRSVARPAIAPAEDDGTSVQARTLLTLRDSLGPEVFPALFERYRQETTTGIARLSDGSGPPADRRGLAHRLAGGAAMFGAQDLHRALNALEDGLRQNGEDAAPELTARLLPIWQATQGAYGRLLDMNTAAALR